MKHLLVVILAIGLFSCAGPVKKTEQPVSPVIAYVYMDKIFFRMREKWRDVERLETQLQQLIEREQTVSQRLIEEPANPIHSRDLRRIGNDRRNIEEQMAVLKQKMMGQIHDAISRVAKKQNIDFVTVMGEGIVYGPPGSDITDHVIQELLSLKARNEPVSR